jgi:predicted aldo/keto reductase-like oxidoreductase
MRTALPTAILGKTGLRVSRLGFGCMRLPMEGKRVNRARAIPLLRRAVELGVTYFDTAAGYCHEDSQRALGEAMVGLRDRVVLSTKNPHYNKADEKTWWTNLENSLERLRTDRIDVYNFHGLTWQKFTEHVKGPRGQIRWMLRAKREGLIRHACCSFHDTAAALKKLASTGLFEAVTLQYNLLDRSNEEAFEHVSRKCGMGIVVMGPVGGGRLGAPSHKMQALIPGARSVAEVALRFVLANPHVTVALSGMNAVRQLEENARVAREAGPLTRAQSSRVDAALRRLRKLADLYCTGCRYCMPCPHGVNIPANFSAFNLARVYGLQGAAERSYARLAKGQAAFCVDCGACVSKCPQRIPIPRQLRATARMLG